MTATAAALGPFILQEAIGRGGMGEVWRAVHREQGEAVAIKIITSERAREAKFRDAFLSEVRAVARLDHPGVIRVFDAGIAQASAGPGFEGRAYLAMELGAGTLEEVERTQLNWDTCRSILLELLDALAHAHARGVVHRDLKPANILFVQTTQGLDLKLTDFGLAHALDGDQGTAALDGGLIMGTANYMAPEQVRAEWRTQGPWTDLYSLGCVAYGLITGAPPFADLVSTQRLFAQVNTPAPPMTPLFPIPQGLEEWLQKLMEKDRGRRYRRAADAAHDLAAFKGLAWSGARPEITLSQLLKIADETACLDDTEISAAVAEPEHGSAPAAVSERAGSQPDTSPGELGRLPPMPREWRRGEKGELTRASETPPLVGVGLGLYGLRPVPLVGREAERDVLWSALLDVHTRRRTGLLVLSGPTGVGKSCLGGWLVERAHEVGAVTALKAKHSPISGPADGFARMLADYLRCTGLRREEMVDRVRSFVGGGHGVTSEDLYQCMALTELLSPAAAEPAGKQDARVRFSKPRDRHLVFQHFLKHVARRRRPILLWIDDAQWGGDTLGYVEHLLSLPPNEELPVLVVLALCPEDASGHERNLETIERLLAFDRAQRLDLGPLPVRDHKRLITELLGLNPALTDKVATRTAGNPLFAVQLVGDWVSRGVLVPRIDGFGLRSGDDAPLPDDIYHLLRERFTELHRRLSRPQAGSTESAIEIAAALGIDVDWQEWVAALQGHPLAPAPDELVSLVNALVHAGLASKDERGFCFANGAVRECLERSARHNGRWQQCHEACAQMLRTRYPKGYPGRAQRLGQHLLQAQQWQAALEPFMDAAMEFNLAGDAGPAHAALDLYDEALDHLGLSDDNPQRARGWLRRTAVYLRQERRDDGKALLERTLATARARGWKAVLADALYSSSSFSNQAGMVHEGLAFATEALDLYRSIMDAYGEARCLNRLGELAGATGDIEQALGYHEEARRRFVALKMPWELAVTHVGLGHAALHKGDYKTALTWTELAMQGFRATGDIWNLCHSHNTIGEIYRSIGDAAQAQVHYKTADDLYRQLGSDRFHIVIGFNLSLTMLAQNRFEEALPGFQAFLDAMLASDRQGFIGLAHTALLPCLAARADWAGFEHHLAEALSKLETSGLVDKDIAELFEHAGRTARHLGQSEHARTALTLATQHWRALQNTPKVTELEALLAGL